MADLFSLVLILSFTYLDVFEIQQKRVVIFMPKSLLWKWSIGPWKDFLTQWHEPPLFENLYIFV